MIGRNALCYADMENGSFFNAQKFIHPHTAWLTTRSPLLSWQIQFSAKGINTPDKSRVSVPATWVLSLPFSPPLSLWWVFWDVGLVSIGGVWTATILDINYDQEEGKKSSQILSWLTEEARSLWHSSYNIIFGVTWTWGYVNARQKKKKKKICCALTMHSVSDGFNYQND